MGKLTEIREYAEMKMKEFNLIQSGWEFVYQTRKKRTLGICNYHDKTISINLDFAKNHGLDEQMIDTIIHEIAHALTPGCGHGPVWKAMCVRLGARPERTVDAGTVNGSPHKWELRWNDKIVGKYYRKPTKDFSRSWMKGYPESKGELKLYKVA